MKKHWSQKDRRETEEIAATKTNEWKHFKNNGGVSWLNAIEVDEIFESKFHWICYATSNLMVIIVMKCHNLRLNSNKWRVLTLSYTCNTIKPWRIPLGLAREKHLNPGEVTFVFWNNYYVFKKRKSVGKQWVEI